MKTMNISRDDDDLRVTLELGEFELTTLVALVEQGQNQLRYCPGTAELHEHMVETANEFRSLLGHLVLLAAND